MTRTGCSNSAQYAEDTGDVERLVDFIRASDTLGCERFASFVLAGNWEPSVMRGLEEAFDGHRPRTLAALLVGLVDKWGDEHVLVEFRSRAMNWDVEAA